jgi:hypothetical protein
MSPPPSASSTTKPKKPKGRQPAHQNATAWKHNPKSKKTAKILSSPISGVCRRCRDKLEWRKRYRKYKPRTTVGACNLCSQKRVYAAYHTICEPCSLGGADKVGRLLRALKSAGGGDGGGTSSTDEEQGRTRRQICCICVDEPALPNHAGDRSFDDAQAEALPPSSSCSSHPLRLREVKARERQAVRRRAAGATAPNKGGSGDRQVSNGDEGDDDEDDDGGDAVGDDGASDSDESGAQDDDGNEHDEGADSDDEDDDPFLKAVGGRDNLLVGEAYQQRMLELDLNCKLQLHLPTTTGAERTS